MGERDGQVSNIQILGACLCLSGWGSMDTVFWRTSNTQNLLFSAK